MNRRQVAVQGHNKELYLEPGPTRCGKVTDGVAFEFGDEGSWVISLQELEALVCAAKVAHFDQAAWMRKGERHD
jgi:hypothetical protein